MGNVYKTIYMRKLITIFFLYFLITKLFAPAGYEVIIREEPIMPYEAFWLAVVAVESKGDALAYNPKEQSTGICQIRPVRLKDYNKRTGNKLILKDCYDYKTSKTIFMSYMIKYRPDDIKGMCRCWNGKSKHNKYYLKVQRQLKTI
jgi:hypothetical protein